MHNLPKNPPQTVNIGSTANLSFPTNLRRNIFLIIDPLISILNFTLVQWSRQTPISIKDSLLIKDMNIINSQIDKDYILNMPFFQTLRNFQ